MSNEMVERVAKAIEPIHYKFNCRCNHCLEIHRLARLAIEAMREPTNGQRNSYFKMKCSSGYIPADSVFIDAEWERMIDATLDE